MSNEMKKIDVNGVEDWREYDFDGCEWNEIPQ
jgi:hypothetical protein